MKKEKYVWYYTVDFENKIGEYHCFSGELETYKEALKEYRMAKASVGKGDVYLHIFKNIYKVLDDEVLKENILESIHDCDDRLKFEENRPILTCKLK